MEPEQASASDGALSPVDPTDSHQLQVSERKFSGLELCFPPEVEKYLLQHLILNDVKSLRTTSKALHNSRILIRIENSAKECKRVWRKISRFEGLYYYGLESNLGVADVPNWVKDYEQAFATESLATESLALAKQETSDIGKLKIYRPIIKRIRDDAQQQWYTYLDPSKPGIPYIRGCEAGGDPATFTLSCPGLYSGCEIRYCTTPSCSRTYCVGCALRHQWISLDQNNSVPVEPGVWLCASCFDSGHEDEEILLDWYD